MERIIMKSFLNTNFIQNSLFFVAAFLISSTQSQAFFESQMKYNFENKWILMLNDSSKIKQFKAMRAFLLYPEFGLPVLRKMIKTLENKNIPWQIGSLIGMLGDSSDVPNLLKISKKLEGEKRSKIFFGAAQRIYSRQKFSGTAKPIISKIFLKFKENGFSSSDKEKVLLINFKIKNPTKSIIFLRAEAHFWRTGTNENLSAEFFWLKPGEKLDAKIETTLTPSINSKNIRLDFRVWEVGLAEHIYHQTLNYPI